MLVVLAATLLEGRARLPKRPFLCDSRVPFQESIYWRFRSNWWFRSILIARRPFRSPFRSFQSISIISMYFDHFNLFRSFQSISIISIISIYFNLFRSISIHFDSHIGIAKTFRWRAGYISIISSYVTAKMAHDGSCCHLTFASFTPIMQEYDISWLIWRFSDGKVEKQQ
jgi:hypothetical protein